MRAVNTEALKSLASQEDVADIFNLYADFFPTVFDSVSLVDQVPTIGFQFGESVDGLDLGVEVESSLSPAALANNLGFIQGLPLLFSTYRHRGGLSAWDVANAQLFDPSKAAEDVDMQPISLHWHQLAGVHSVIRKIFTETPNSGGCHGILIADEVGLGKTFQAATLIAFLSDFILRQSFEPPIPLPPIIRKFFLCPSL